MNRSSIVTSCLMLHAVTGCNEPEPGPPDVMTVGTAITITSDTTPSLVAVRDGVDGAWRAATMKTPTTFEAEVHGPYMVTVVCEDRTLGNVSTLQAGRALDDEHVVRLPCGVAAPSVHVVSGRMLQAGSVQIDNTAGASVAADWTFSLRAGDGTFDLMAKSPDRIALRRAIVVGGDVAVTPPLDVVQDGTALATVAFTATNAAADEALVASVHLDQPERRSPFGIYRGLPAVAKVLPDSALTPADAQTVSIQATAGSELRALRRPFRVGGNTVYTLPASIGRVQWDQADGNLTVRASSLRELDPLSVTAHGASADGTRARDYVLELTPGFVTATGSAGATIDTHMAGYQPAWRINFAGAYSRMLFVQRVVNGEIMTNQATETFNAVTAPGPAPHSPHSLDGVAVPP